MPLILTQICDTIHLMNILVGIFEFLLEILSAISLVVFIPAYFIIRLAMGKSTEGFLEKTGLKPAVKGVLPDDKIIMFHGVSVGEVIALENLIKLAKTEFPGYKILITTGTKTGQDIAKKKYAEIADFIAFFPFDMPFSVKKFFNTINLEIILMAETELWPAFAHYAKRKNIPLVLINGRISDDSFKTYKYFSWFFRGLFACYTGIYTQSEDDKTKIIKMGANPIKVDVMKNLKFDIQKNTAPIDFKKAKERILLAGSTHKGEDEILISAYKALRPKFPDLRLMIAPRHLNRVDSIVEMVKKEGFSCGFRSKNEDFQSPVSVLDDTNPENKHYDIILLDTLGELSRMYSVSDIAFIGGSFNNTGGHNPLEAVIYSKPVISGPSIKNFKDIYGILTKTDAAYIAKTPKALEERLYALLSDPDFYKKASNDSGEIFESQKGAKDFVIEKVKEILK